MRPAVALATLLATLAVAGAAWASDVYTVAGGGPLPLRDGAAAGLVNLVQGRLDVAADPRGGFVTAVGGRPRVYPIGPDGRMTLVAGRPETVEVQRCRRLGARRVDCPGVIGRDCTGVLSMIAGSAMTFADMRWTHSVALAHERGDARPRGA